MRRELQVEPLILCLVQPAPSGTRAYIPKITEDQNNHNKNRNNHNFQKRNNNNLNTPRLLQVFHKFNLYLRKQRYVHQAGCFFQTQHQIGILNGLPTAAFGKIV